MRRLKIINMSNFLCLATLLRKNNRKAKMSEEWSNNSNPVAVGI